jgi:predicted nucleic acid-binding protein
MRDVVVVDTSIAIKWVLQESDSDIAETMLIEWSSNGVVILAPALLTYEVTNALYKKARKGEITFETATEALTKVLLSGVALNFSQDSNLGRRAIELAHQFGLTATYDAHYLALAEREGCELWTADKRMWNSIRGKLTWVRWIGDYHSGED